jgi:hypothetical protein
MLTGIPAVREAIDAGRDLESVATLALTGADRYRSGRNAALLFD